MLNQAKTLYEPWSKESYPHLSITEVSHYKCIHRLFLQQNTMMFNCRVEFQDHLMIILFLPVSPLPAVTENEGKMVKLNIWRINLILNVILGAIQYLHIVSHVFYPSIAWLWTIWLQKYTKLVCVDLCGGQLEVQDRVDIYMLIKLKGHNRRNKKEISEWPH